MVKALRQGALRYCPVYDGYEAIGRTVGAYGCSACAVAEAVFVRHFTPRVTVFMEGGADALARDAHERLPQARFQVVADPVSSVRLSGGRITVVHGAQDSVCDSLYGALDLEIHNQCAPQRGAACDEDGYVIVDAHGATSIAGLYAAATCPRG